MALRNSSSSLSLRRSKFDARVVMRARERGITAAKKCRSLVVEKFMKEKSEMSEIFTHYFIEETQGLRRVVFRGLRRNVRNLGFHIGKIPA